MKNLFQLIFLGSISISCSNADLPLYEWRFDGEERKTVTEWITKKEYPIKSNFEIPEFVEGVENTGLRFDGYSTYIEGDFPEPVPLPLTISSWVALETYPTADAGFFSLIDTTGNPVNWISACVNKFGTPTLAYHLNGQLKTVEAENTIPKFKWLNVGLSIDHKRIDLLINGSVVISENIDPIKDMDFQNFTIGKKSDEEYLHDLFPISRINGIIDEVKIWDHQIDLSKLNQESNVADCPDLTVPESRFSKDFNRPKYHILPAANWTNEPHGLIYHNGRYHIFNQKNGTNLYLGQINWGHFSSPDLVQWTEHRPVLTPEEGYDQYGIWSGHVIKDDSGEPVIFYTGGDGNEFGMCMAYPKDDRLIQWTKYQDNPVVKGPPEGYSRKDFRDPYVWKENDTWYMMVGFGIVEDRIEKGALLLYKSSNLKSWTYLHELYKSEPEIYDTGIFWEMSTFWKFGDKYVLLVNPIPYKGKPAIALYWVGDFVNERFVPDNKTPKKLEVINRLLSPSVSRDVNGNTVAIGIIPDLIYPKLQLKQGWTHLFSIPRIWKLENGEIHQSPHPALKKLRDSVVDFQAQKVLPGKNLEVIKGLHQVEIEAQMKITSADKFGFLIGKNEANGEETKIYFDLRKDQLVVDKSNSSKTELIKNTIETGDFPLRKGEKINLQLFIDGSVVEGFINDKSAFTTRIFPKSKTSNEIELFVEEGELIIEKLQVWRLKNSNNKTEFCDAD